MIYKNVLRKLFISFQIADACEYLKLHLVDGAKVLDLGSGSGYQTCVFAHLVGPTGKVIGVEHIPELIEGSLRNISKGNKELLDSERVRIVGKYLFSTEYKSWYFNIPFFCQHFTHIRHIRQGIMPSSIFLKIE